VTRLGTSIRPSPPGRRTQAYWDLIAGIDVDLTLPQEGSLNRLFLNTNWAHLIDPRRYDPGNYRGFLQIPVIQYRNGQEQSAAVTTVMEKILSALSDFDRSHLKAIEWSLNEITDNVINHAQSPIGGLLQVTNFRSERRVIEFYVCDAGIGIPASLKSGHKEIRSDQEALDKAIREGVTRDKSAGQGNGLYGSWRISQLSGGSFEIHAGHASLASWSDTLHVRPETIPFNGSLVVVAINYAKPLSLEEALKFGGKPHDPMDHVQLSYEEDEEGIVIFSLAEQTQGFGSRAAAIPVRLEVMNKRIGHLLHRDQTIGHAYLMHVRDFPALRRVLSREIIPLLQEYFYEDWKRIRLVLADHTVPSEHQLVRSSTVAGQDLFFDADDEKLAEATQYAVTPEPEITPEAVRKIYESHE